MVISAQWEIVLGNTYAYIVLSAFGFFYGGYGAIITPLFGVTSSYGADTTEYNNALGFFLICEQAQGSKTKAPLTSYSVGCLEPVFPARIIAIVS